MRSIVSLLLLLPALAVAGPLLTRQAGQSATVLNVTSDGPACPPDSITYQIGPDSKNVTVTFSKFRTQYAATSGAPPEDRDLFCNIRWTLNFPIGCTKADLITQTRGQPIIEQGGVTGNYFPTYILSTGNLVGGNPTPTSFDSRTSVGFWVRQDSPTVTVDIRNANEQNIPFEGRTRLSIQPISDTLIGVVFVDSIDLAIANQRPC